MMKAAALFCLVLYASAFCQGTKEDYDRANSLQRRFANKVYRSDVRANWIGDRFWYLLNLPGGEKQFILVDAAKATKAPAFDHERVAKALADRLQKEIDPKRLPIEKIDFAPDLKTIDLTVGAEILRCDLADYSLTKVEGGGDRLTPMHPDSAPKASASTGEETWVTFVNAASFEIQLFWLEQSGAAIAYSKIAPGDSFRQHTYAGHVWAIAKPNGDYIAIFQADTEPRIALIDGSTPARAAPRGGGGGAGRSPDGSKRIAFRDHNAILNRGDNETPITTNGSESNYYEGGAFWSPNSASAVFFRTAPGEKRKIHIVESSPRDQVQPKLRTHDYEKPGDRLDHPKPVLWRDGELIEIDDSLFPNPWPNRRVEWAPDSQSFILVYNQRGHQLMRVIRVDAQTGQSKLIVEEKTDTFIDYTNKIVRHFLWDTEEIIWMSERNGWNHLYLFDMKTGDLKNPITQGQWVVRGIDRVDTEKRQIWFRAGGIHPAQDPYHVHYCRVDFDGSNLTILTQGDGTHTVSYSPNGQWMLDVYSRVDLPPVTELRRAGDGSLIMEIERADATELIAEGWKPPVRFVAKGRDGQTDIHGILFFPMNHDPNKKYPVIENVYAGPQGSHVRKNFAVNDMRQSLAELGFIVVQADGMGTSNRSKAFHDVCFKNLADAGFPDRIAWLRAAAQQFPSIDLDRVGIYGGSAGGQNALGGMLLHGDFYKAAVADCGCHDNRMDKVWWNEQWMGYPLGEHYEQQSNVTLAPRLQGKLLLMVGELDNNVDPASTMQVVNALIRADKDFELLVMPGIGHGTYGTPYGRRRLMDFFVRSLWNAEPRAAGATSPNTEN